VFLLDFDGDVYGRRVRVDFLHKLRDEAKYDTLDALKVQIGRDVDDTRAFFLQRAASGAAPRNHSSDSTLHCP
jgi:riboflavin kinase/FMN adenylyltransferase